MLRNAGQAVRRLRVPAVLASGGNNNSNNCALQKGRELLDRWEEPPSQLLRSRQALPYDTFEEAVATAPAHWERVVYQEKLPHLSANQQNAGLQWEQIRHFMLRFDNFFPADVGLVVGDWMPVDGEQKNSRTMQPNDRFVESIVLFPPMPRVASMWCMDIVANVFDDPERVGCT